MFIHTAPILRSTLLDSVPGISHAFSTRHGGVSTLPHTASLNLTRDLGDDNRTVDANLDIFAHLASENRFDRTRAVTAHQIHSAKVRVIDDSNAGEGCSRERGEDCDGFVTATPGVIPIIRVADCVPILLAGLRDDGRPVVSAVHAGWRGTVSGITAEAVARMTDLGARLRTVKAAVGPHIGLCCFEVGEDFVTAVSDIRGADFAARHIVPSPKHVPGKFHADLTGMNREILEAAGVLPENIDTCPLCTMCDTGTFYSHRGMNSRRGTMGAGICITA
ncbi:MAG: laccase domain-containing protein [Clostridia bacterium]|nr:laccase domain-containing protein [Clostridia bacterium]